MREYAWRWPYSCAFMHAAVFLGVGTVIDPLMEALAGWRRSDLPPRLASAMAFGALMSWWLRRRTSGRRESVVR